MNITACSGPCAPNCRWHMRAYPSTFPTKRRDYRDKDTPLRVLFALHAARMAEKGADILLQMLTSIAAARQGQLRGAHAPNT